MNLSLSPRNLLAVLVLAIVLVIGGLKGFIYYKYKNAVDSFSQQIQLFATLRYEGISSSLLDKSVSIENVSLIPAGFDNGFKIDAITLQTPDYGTLLNGINSRRGQLPEALQLGLTGLKIDLYGSMLDQLEQVLNRMNALTNGMATECGNITVMGPNQYRQMGYEILDSNVRLSYRLVPGQGLHLTSNWSTSEMGMVDMDMWFSGINQLSAAAMARSEPPSLREMTFTYTDLSYIKRANEYCAKASNRSVEAYIQAQTSQTDDYYARTMGLVPGPGLKQAYKDFLTNPGSVKVSIQPPKEFDENSLALYKPEDLADILNLKLEVNDKPVTDLSFKFTVPSASEAASLEDRLTTFQKLLKDKDAVIEKPKARLKGPAPQFHVVQASQLKQFIAFKIRVTMLNKQVREGYLKQVRGNTIYVGQSVHGGEFTMNLNLSDVKKLEVFYAK